MIRNQNRIDVIQPSENAVPNRTVHERTMAGKIGRYPKIATIAEEKMNPEDA